MDYKEWMIRHYLDNDTSKGDFARDIKDDTAFPRHRDFNTLVGYLINRCACDEALMVFTETYKDYENQQYIIHGFDR